MHQQPTSQAQQVAQQQYYQQVQQNQYVSGGTGPGIVRQSSQQQSLPPLYPNGSPQRRFLSEGELLGRNNGGSGNELSFAGRNNNNTTENIRELAQSPQRGIYNWKIEDNSPTGFNQMVGSGMMFTANPNAVGQNNSNVVANNSNLNRPIVQQQQLTSQQYHPEYNSMFHRSNPTSPTQQQLTQVSTQPQQFNQNGAIVTMAMSAQQQQQTQPPVSRQQSNVSNIINNIVAKSANTSSYHPALRGGIQVFPPQLTVSPQIKRKQTPTRPMSFVRALEMADSIEMTATNSASGTQGGEGGLQDVNKNNSSSNNNGESGNQTPSQNQQQNAADRGSVYDMNYEISV